MSETVVNIGYGSHQAQYAPQIKAGTIVRNVKTYQERTVVSYRPDMGLIEFDDSNLVGWADAQGWVPIGETAATK